MFVQTLFTPNETNAIIPAVSSMHEASTISPTLQVSRQRIMFTESRLFLPLLLLLVEIPQHDCYEDSKEGEEQKVVVEDSRDMGIVIVGAL